MLWGILTPTEVTLMGPSMKFRLSVLRCQIGATVLFSTSFLLPVILLTFRPRMVGCREYRGTVSGAPDDSCLGSDHLLFFFQFCAHSVPQFPHLLHRDGICFTVQLDYMPITVAVSILSYHLSSFQRSQTLTGFPWRLERLQGTSWFTEIGNGLQH